MELVGLNFNSIVDNMGLIQVLMKLTNKEIEKIKIYSDEIQNEFNKVDVTSNESVIFKYEIINLNENADIDNILSNIRKLDFKDVVEFLKFVYTPEVLMENIKIKEIINVSLAKQTRCYTKWNIELITMDDNMHNIVINSYNFTTYNRLIQKLNYYNTIKQVKELDRTKYLRYLLPVTN